MLRWNEITATRKNVVGHITVLVVGHITEYKESKSSQ